MKNISLALNIALLLAIGFLYYKDFSGSKNETAISAVNKDSTVATPAPIIAMTDLPKNMPFVFINADSIYAKYDYAKKTKAILESKVAAYQRSYQAKTEAFQKEYQEYMQKAQAGAYTKEQGQVIEEGLQNKRDEIMAMEQNQDKVTSEMDNSNADVQKSVYDFLARFNKEHGYNCVMAYTRSGGGVLGVNDSLDVTPQVLAGLNAEYKAKRK